MGGGERVDGGGLMDVYTTLLNNPFCRILDIAYRQEIGWYRILRIFFLFKNRPSLA
jgi:hypothetical protein